MKVLIVDDEPLARQRLARLVAEDEGYQVVAEADNGQQAITLVNEHHPDILLMDIRMPVMDGLAAARALMAMDEPPAVIFCTAYNDYALEAFDANAVGYLLKPVNRDKLSQALAQAQKLNKLQLASLAEGDKQGASEQRHYISAKSSRGIELVPVADIRYFLADQKYVTIMYQREGQLVEILIDDTLKELEDEFDQQFIRLHRNALVAIRHLTGVDRRGSNFYARLAGVEQGPQVSRRHMPELRKFLSSL
ncbi:LytTR family DNA-binding domain-containing protein [Dasania marina]|uniref:LytR/AlgR family response regulator transcription factor n=1 Tax=Dasania marina TaxID=471499 RepID=UPI0030D95822|tara:strand:- start:24781 stop:25530 length:750 start_codon:yes stop_codon:yes gene_type:complete